MSDQEATRPPEAVELTPDVITPDVISAWVARSDRRQAALAKSTPEQAAARERYYRELDKRHLRLSARKRQQGHGDCSRELAAAERQAAAVVFPRVVNTAPPRTARARGAGRPRAAATRSSAKSGDSGSDDGSEPDEAPPAAREAVALVWEGILRTRTPGVAWEVQR